MCLTVRPLPLFRGSTEIRQVGLVTPGAGAALPGWRFGQPRAVLLLSFLLLALLCLMSGAPAVAVALPRKPASMLAHSRGAPSAATVNQSGPLLQIVSPSPVLTGQVITVAINFQPNSFSITATSFSLDLDQSCLGFDPTDQNKDGRPDTIVFHTPAGMSAAVAVNLQDSDSELDFIIADYFPPFTTLPDRTPLIEIALRTICQPAAGTTINALLIFAGDPMPSFGSVSGASVPGTAINGAVTIEGPAVIATVTPTATATPTVTPVGTATNTPTVPTTLPTSEPTLTPTLLPTTFPLTLVDHFTATVTGAGIQLAWQTHYEAATAGFYLYRKRIDLQSSSFDFQPLTALVPGQGNAGGRYQVQDAQVELGARYLYLLVEEKANGEHLAYVDLLVLVTLTEQAPHQAWLPLIRR